MGQKRSVLRREGTPRSKSRAEAALSWHREGCGRLHPLHSRSIIPFSIKACSQDYLLSIAEQVTFWTQLGSTFWGQGWGVFCFVWCLTWSKFFMIKSFLQLHTPLLLIQDLYLPNEWYRVLGQRPRTCQGQSYFDQHLRAKPMIWAAYGTAAKNEDFRSTVLGSRSVSDGRLPLGRFLYSEAPMSLCKKGVRRVCSS